MKTFIKKETSIKILELHEREYSNSQIFNSLISEDINLNIVSIRSVINRNGLKSNKFDLLKNTELLEQFILGSILGDGYLRKIEGFAKTSRLHFGHSEKQLEYITWKFNFLNEYNLVGAKPHKYTHVSDRYKNGNCISYFLNSKSHPIFSNYRNLFYKDNIKIIDKNTISKLNPFGLAIWYMDDGYLWKPGNKPPKSRLCTTSFDDESIEILMKLLKNTFQINSKFYYDRELCIDLNSMSTFMDIIKPYILPLFNYKLI